MESYEPSGYLLNRPQDVPCTRCNWRPGPDSIWPSLGGVAVRWIETNLIFGEGDFFGEPFRLRWDQKLFLYAWYEFCPSCDQWRYSDALRFEATGGGKTQFVAAIVALEFAGPPEICPTSPNIPIAAASFEQADLCFGQVAIMFGGREDDIETPLRGQYDVYDTEIKRKGGEPGIIRRIAAVAGTNEGGLPSLFVCDELHEWGDVGTTKARVHTVVGKSTKKRRMRNPDRGCGRILNISTAGFDRENSLLGKMYDRCKKILLNPQIDPRFLVNIYEARPGLNYNDPAQREIACRDASPAADVIWGVADRVAEWGKIENHEFMRYYGNTWPEINEDSWLKDHPQSWEHCVGSWTSDPEEHPWVLSVDMALKHDSVAVVRCEWLPEDLIAVTAKIWKAGEFGGRIPHDDIWDYIDARARGRGFRGVVYDPRYFEVPAKKLEAKNVRVIEFAQSPELMAPACGLTKKMILERRIVTETNVDFNKHVKAAVAVPLERGGFVLKKGRSKGHIDGCIAMCMGVQTLHSLPKSMKPKFAFAKMRRPPAQAVPVNPDGTLKG